MANECQLPCCIPASPNWFCSGTASCNGNGYYAFAARDSVYLINLKDSFPTCSDVFQIQKTRITCVAVLTMDLVGPVIGACGTEDFCIKLWSSETKQAFIEHRKHQTKVNAIIVHDKCCITSGDEKGLMITWNHESDDFQSWIPIQSSILSMAVCPHDKWIIGVGYGNGHVLVGNIKKQEIIQHYKNHLDEVQSIAWCPFLNFSYNDGKDKNISDSYCFVSGSKDKTIKIWDMAKENPILNFILPSRTHGQKGRRKFDEMNRTKMWSALSWYKRDSIVSNSMSGEMLVLDLNTKEWKFISSAHTRIIFTLSHDSLSKKLLSTSMDRQIMIWDDSSFEHITSIPSIGGFVYSICSSVLNPHSIIYGCGDNMIRNWNTRSPERPYETNCLWQGIKSKVTVVTCLRNKEGVIGFATDDGHVGIYNVLTGKFEVSASYHKKTVYSLSWGPSCGDNEKGKAMEGNSLFSCGGEGSVLIHSMLNLQTKARDMNSIIRRTNNLKEKLPCRSDIEWKEDLSVVAVGNDDGSIEVFAAPDLHQLCIIHVHKKIINCMKWHHELDYLNKENVTSYSNWLASGSSDNYVCVTNLTSALDADKSDTKDGRIVIRDKFRYFNSHSQRITDLSWNPHTVGILASSSFDGSVQIWNVVKNEPLANFRGHSGRVLCVSWSYIDEDVVYSGAEDFTLRRWKISDCKHTTPPASKKSGAASNAKTVKTKRQAIGKSSTPDVDFIDASKEDSVDVTAKTVDAADIKSTSNASSNISLDQNVSNASNQDDKKEESTCESTQQDKIVDEMLYKKTRSKDTKKKKVKSLFPLFSTFNHKQKTASQRECVLLAQYLKNPSVSREADDEFVPGKGDHVNLGLFAGKSSIYQMFAQEGINHKKLGNIDQQVHLELWKGNLAGALEIFKEKGELNEMAVAMSPLGGFDVWRATMEAYADQLSTNGEFQMAASYYLAVNKTQEAIEMYKKQSMYKEAIAIAKIRLPSAHPLLRELYQVWGDKLSADGCFEHAAKCYLAGNQFDDAINILARKGDISSLRTAAEVAIIYERQDVAQTLLTRVGNMLLVEMQWNSLQETLLLLQDRKELSFLAAVHKCLCRCILSTEMDVQLEVTSTFEANVSSNAKDVSLTSLLKLRELGFQAHSMQLTFLEVICLLFYEEFQEMPSIDVVQSEPVQLSGQRIFESLGKPVNYKKMLVAVSHQLMYGMLYLLGGNAKRCFMHWLTALDLCFSACQYKLVERLYMMLFPRDFISVDEYLEISFIRRKVQVTERTDKGVQSVFRNFLAFYHSSILYRFWWEHFPRLRRSGENETESRKGISSPEIPILNVEEVLQSNGTSLLERYGEWISNLANRRCFCDDVHLDVLNVLSPLSVILLSELHARAAQLKWRIADSEQKIMETRIRNQLRQHLMNRSEEVRKKNKMSGKTAGCGEDIDRRVKNPNDDDNWRARDGRLTASKETRSTDQEGDEINTNCLVSSVEENGNDADSRAAHTSFSVYNSLDLDLGVSDHQCLESLIEENNAMIAELAAVPEDVKDFLFPDAIENAKTLLFIAMLFNTDKNLLDAKKLKFRRLAEDLISWGLNSSFVDTDVKHFESLRNKLNI